MERGGKFDRVFESVEGKTWLDHMTGYLHWKVSGLDLNNPYKQPPTITYLKRMVADESFLMTHIAVRCTCDGHEVLVLHNPEFPRIQSDHPSVSNLSPNEIMEHILRNKIDQMIFQEADRMRGEIEALIKALESKKSTPEAKNIKAKQQKPAAKKEKAQEPTLRIIRR